MLIIVVVRKKAEKRGKKGKYQALSKEIYKKKKIKREKEKKRKLKKEIESGLSYVT